ncbi:MAG: helix-turn-helix domain-containing protein, partial [Candidatus Latescibacteria bacterium]|nr:helix-turn-helix domain-containing protein [Candidatus Latescibacterota bacterium]
MNEMAQNHGISEAAEILKVTDKTIRNYINKGFLKPEKWNGSWRISHTEISEIFWKKFGKKLDQDGGIGIETQNQIIVEKTEYEDQQRDLGKLSALELNEKTLRANIQELNERNAQLEASAASGWTEARAIKEEV